MGNSRFNRSALNVGSLPLVPRRFQKYLGWFWGRKASLIRGGIKGKLFCLLVLTCRVGYCIAVAVDVDLASGASNIYSLIAGSFIIWQGTCMYYIESLFSDLRSCQSMTLCIELHAFPTHLRSSSMYYDTLCTRLCMLCNSALPPASAPPHMLPLLVCLFVYLCHQCMCCLFCLFVSPSGLVLLIDGQWTSAKSNHTHSIRRGLGRRLRSSLLLNSSLSTSRDHPLVT